MANRPYKRYADLVVLLHFSWTFLLIAGAVTMLFYPPYALLQIIFMTGTLLWSLPFKGKCSLLILEESFRKKIDPAYPPRDSFLAPYMSKIFRTKLSNGSAMKILGGLYTVAYAAAIGSLILYYSTKQFQ